METTSYRALRESWGLLELTELGILRIEGADAADLLQRVSSQEVVTMPVGRSARAAVLGGKGKLLALFDLARLGPTSFVAELPRARTGELEALLDRYVFAEDIRFEAPDVVGIGIYGPQAYEAAGVSEGASALVDDVARIVGASVGTQAVRYWGSPEAIETVREGFADAPQGDMADWHALRIDAAAPMIGLDADEKTLPLEVGLDDACDPDKGCYPGQEIVARIRTYGHVNRKLCRLRAPSLPELPSNGTLLFDEDVEAGRWTSCYREPGSEVVHALAMLPRVLAAAGSEVQVGDAEGPTAVVV